MSNLETGDWERRPLHRNVGLLQNGFRSYLGGDFDSMAQMFTEDVVIHVNGYPDNPFTGDHRGREGLRFLFSTTKENQDEERWDVEDFAANDDFAVALVRMSGKREGRSASIPVVQVFRLKEGMCNEAWYVMPTEQFRPDQEYWGGMPLKFNPGRVQ
jgi:ketosteroid isomerase-like protein